ncbi:ABC transporter substrate binding protein [Candidatus Albibeggiatoa sp. nov. NOAA]|uniref:ABC transporter substrate-binding protein n=1 Tax=Candidatus Albibeggiatoa sp. nov. NOAA TaxID=3162724 RepID=UPI0032F90BB1|nr:ABC transporter substrate-binding protein [Thiotrichaceae bacterium]
MMRRFILLLAMLLHSTVWATEQYTDRKVMLLHSYHDGYPWTRDITKGVKEVFLGTGIKLKIFYMDTKRRRSEQEKQAAAVKAKAAIEAFKPDVLIAADDNAAKYIIMPFYKNTDLPVVFCGINSDASIYGFTDKNTKLSIVPNITGMLEKHPTNHTLKHLQLYARGNRIGSLGVDGISERVASRNVQNTFGRDFDKVYLHTHYQDWKKSFLKLQNEVDMLFMHNPYGLEGWDAEDAEQFIEQHIKIPSGSTLSAIMPFSVFGIVQKGFEQGEWAAKASLRILNGEKPIDIPVASNKGGKLKINMRLVNQLQLKIDLKLLKTADIIR